MCIKLAFKVLFSQQLQKKTFFAENKKNTVDIRKLKPW